MDINESLSVFSALSNAPRLEAFRLLIWAGETGLTSGDVGTRLNAKQNTTSTNLSILQAAGLIHSTREGRSIRYRANMDGVRGLLEFLLEDCCGGNPETCASLLDEVTCCG